ncbi:MAG: hypothetical protein LBJ18_02215, partial [Rickettsiales bacterium]|nr:hypothetical protein [Rickettsiales bacterium]
ADIATATYVSAYLQQEWALVFPGNYAGPVSERFVASVIDWANLQRVGVATTYAANARANIIDAIAAKNFMDAQIRNRPGYCAGLNKNLCNMGSLCYYYNSGYTAWDGTQNSCSKNTLSADGKVVCKARPNSYGIRGLTWACRSSKDAPTSDTTGQCDMGRQMYCMCSFTKDDENDPDTFVNGKWSSWVFGYDYRTNGTNNDCWASCAAACADRTSSASVGGAVVWN